MKHPRTIAALLALLVLYGCVELTGQRFTWFHDVLNDTFYVLIQYDGIHEGSGSNRKGKDQIPEFIKDEDIMVLDWFFHMRRKEIGRSKERKDPVKAAAARLVDRLKVEVLGRYREPDGRVGAAQLVTIEKFKDFLKEANRLINASLVRLDRETVVSQAKEEGELWRTLDRILAAAMRGRTWVVARGHSLQVSVPVHQDEWAEAKGAAILDTVKELVRGFAKDAEKTELLVRSLAGNAFSYAESGDMVTVTLGNPAVPRTIHVQIRAEYNEQLEAVVVDHVEVDLDGVLRRPPQKGVEANAVLRKVRHWLPREVEIGALLGATEVRTELVDLERAKAELARDEAIKRLHVIGARWNEDRGHPEAPTAKGTSQAEYLAGWHRWYARRRRVAGNPKW